MEKAFEEWWNKNQHYVDEFPTDREISIARQIAWHAWIAGYQYNTDEFVVLKDYKLV